nr:restriction endonuclease [Nitrosomonas aestuarii]
MGYGGSRQDAGRALGKSGDGGIDGIINEDRLGVDVIYIFRLNDGKVLWGDQKFKNLLVRCKDREQERGCLLLLHHSVKKLKNIL